MEPQPGEGGKAVIAGSSDAGSGTRKVIAKRDVEREE